MGDEGILLDAARCGSAAAFGELYARHVGAAHTMARQVARTATDAEDLVAEAFARILDVLNRGGGPTTAFRAYLLTTVRNLATTSNTQDRRLHLAPDVDLVFAEQPRMPSIDSVSDAIDRSLLAQAFARLPLRWQRVLWHLEVEDLPLAEVADRFGMNPNGVSALAYRARKGLREAYLDADRAIPDPRKRSPRPMADAA
ncbi:RNA polymerase sigma factor (sigma-70 family) [Saccharopolyspora erythraea NRRL 2338]|nr:sigma-70 family RNA polymerase sigma factor [Saccharopolyspora erythraea]PFG99379.1 RNA polymerase sigma factor (sigma-70 family) [Saccharopolyspora erythraea NRRL 2338]QRK93980.1 sigma-70 family RNA polymerase sigma factor [Saccharopolyspora erythraea]